MENEFAFDLNGRLRQWRCALKNRPAICDEDIEELETHLRDTMDALSRNGLSLEESFLVGTRRVGHPMELEDQFGCARPAAVWKDRAQWMVLGILCLWMASGLAKIGTSLTLWFGGPLSGNGYALGWAGLAMQALLSLSFGWLAFRAIAGNRGNSATERSKPGLPLTARWIICLSIACVVLGIVGPLLQALAIRETGSHTLAMYFAVTMWGRWLLPAGIIAAGLWLAASSKPKTAGGIAVLVLAGLLVGCNQGGNSANRASLTSHTAGFEVCLELMKTDSNAAMAAFLELNLAQGKLFSPGSALSYSETEFASLPAAAREKLGQQATADVDLVKQLATEVRSRRNAARTAGDTALAERYNTQLAKLGERLEGPDYLKLTQLVGRAVRKMASE